MSWYIGDVEIKNKVALAPMAGISNPAYMRICEEMGLGYAISELISSEAIIRGNKKTFDMLNGFDKLNIPVAVQLFGAVPSNLAKAAMILVNRYHVKIIDINMGCPVPKVAVHAGSGSSLLKNPELVYEIVKEVSSSVPVPVTVKIRSGWDRNSINAVEIAKICEKAGAKCITVHARTRSDGYSGKADWNIIKMVKENVSIPVIGNGDIKSPLDALRMLEQTGCDAIMIGRAALGNPWLIENTVNFLDGKEVAIPSISQKIDKCLRHMKYLSEIKTEKEVVLEMRSNTAWYIKGIANSVEIKNKIFQAKSIDEISNILISFKIEMEKTI